MPTQYFRDHVLETLQPQQTHNLTNKDEAAIANSRQTGAPTLDVDTLPSTWILYKSNPIPSCRH